MKQVWSAILRRCVLATIALAAASAIPARASDQPRGNAIIFSGPKSDTVSSNLNELRTPSSPFRNMESALQKPFNSFDPSPKAKNDLIRPTPQPQPEFRRKSEKEMLNERAEQLFLDPTSASDEKDLYDLGGDSSDPFNRKPKTALDRYYDRVDRATTNRSNPPEIPDYGTASSLDRELNPANGSNPKTTSGRDANASINPFRSTANPYESKRESFFSERARGNSSREDGPASGAAGFSYRQEKTERLDTFKQLLGSSGTPRPSKSQPAFTRGATPAPSLSGAARNNSSISTSSSARTGSSFAESAGLVGTPGKAIGVADYTVSSAPTPSAPPKPVAIPTYNPPRRNF